MAHTVEIKEIINGVQITETIDSDVVVKLISYQSKPFLRTTNESEEETYQVLDIVGEIYNTPALATDFRIIDKNDNVFIPANGVELIEYSLKIRAFRPAADVNEVLAVGPITTTSNSVTLGLHAGGTNAVRIDGLTYEKYYPDLFNFTPVTTGQKILILEARPDATVFYLVQGAESTEAVEPDYDGLFVARIIVDSGGQIVEEEDLNYKERAEDAWRNITIAEDGVFTLNMGNSIAASFSVNVLSGVTTPTIGLIRQKAGKSFWDGSEFWIQNISNKDIILYPSDLDDSGEFKTITFTDTTIVKAESWAKLKIKYGELVVIEMGGGTGVTLEQARLNGNVLEGDVETNQGFRLQSSVNGEDSINSMLILGNNDFRTTLSSYMDQSYSPDGNMKSCYLSTFFDTNDNSVYIRVGGEATNASNDGENVKGIVGEFEYNKQGNRTAFAQLSDVYDAITTETNARIAADKIETVVIALSAFNEDLLDNTSRLGMGVLTFPIKVLSFQTSAYPVPTGSGITTDLRKNGTSVATSVISAGATNSTGNAPPTFSDDTFAIGDRLNFFTPTGGVGSTVKGQNLVATLIIERL